MYIKTAFLRLLMLLNISISTKVMYDRHFIKKLTYNFTISTPKANYFVFGLRSHFTHSIVGIPIPTIEFDVLPKEMQNIKHWFSSFKKSKKLASFRCGGQDSL